MPKQKRDNAYYLKRLQKDRPDLYRDVQDGRLTVARARRLAGLGGSRTRLHELRNAWLRASPEERSEFLHWMGAIEPSSGSVLPPPHAETAWSRDLTLSDWASRHVIEVMHRRNLTPGSLADELGIKRLNVSVMSAVQRGTKVNSSLVREALDKWLKANASV